VARRLGAAPGLDSRLFQIRNGIHAVLGFAFGAAGEKVRSARNAAIGLARQQPPVYCKPTDPPITIKGLPNLRIYVLGPPRSKAAIRLEEKTSEMYRLAGLERGRLAVRALAGGLAASGEVAAAGSDDAVPFDGNTGTSLAAVLDGSAKGSAADFIRSSYASGEPWRRIDDDWMGAASDLAMQLDRGVNNTSLVLAFEDIESERVYLFPGDAQIGSWLSWQDLSWPLGEGETRAADLLARTVYLKVAHHGSHNATPETKGLEMMVSADLSAFVPTNQKDAAKVGWGEMPFHSILSRLSAKTAGRVVRADDSWLAIEDGSPGFPVPSGSIRGLRFAPRDKARGKGGLWVEFDLA
jgi:hypothetical protein